MELCAAALLFVCGNPDKFATKLFSASSGGWEQELVNVDNGLHVIINDRGIRVKE